MPARSVAERAPGIARPRPHHWLIAAVLALACLGAAATGWKPQNLRTYDQPIYLGVAHDLATKGVYTNGRRAASPTEPGAYTAPLYPAMVAAVMRISPVLERDAACVRTATDEGLAACPTSLGLLLPVQIGLAALTLVLVWRTTLAVTDTPAASWAALLAAGILTGEYATYARTAMTEALSLPLAALFGLWLVLLVRTGRVGYAAGAGVALGAVSLTRPEYLYVAYALLPVGALAWALEARRGAERRIGPRLVGVGVLALLVIAPWLVRNWRLFGEAQITVGYSGFILAQRVAYQAMTWREFLASWTYALPAFGPALTRHLFPAADYVRLGWEERPDTFYLQGQVMINRMLVAMPDTAGQVPWLVRNFILPDLPWFAVVTLSMLWKGLWVRKFISLVGVPCLAWASAGRLRRLDRAWIALLAPPALVLLVHAAATVGTPRYSLMLIPCYAAAIGLAVARLPRLARLPRRRPA